MTEPLLSVRDLSKRFGGIQAVRAIDLDVAEGELLGLFGPNGAGKTTLFNLISGAILPDRGRIVFGGRDVTRLKPFKRANAGIARTFQVCRPFRSMTVANNVRAVLPKGTDEAAIGSILQSVGLKDKQDEPAANLTLGMLKRLEVARALALNPRLFLLDEPLAGLSGGETAEFLAFIRELKHKATVILVDHNVRQSLDLCDRAVVMDAGSVIALGPPASVRTDPKVRAAYLGEAVA